jgi:hypothetical protein
VLDVVTQFVAGRVVITWLPAVGARRDEDLGFHMGAYIFDRVHSVASSRSNAFAPRRCTFGPRHRRSQGAALRVLERIVLALDVEVEDLVRRG